MPRAAEPARSSASIDDPDEYRMTFGEHLEELRNRLILGLAGYVVAFIFCLAFVRDWVFPFFAKPLLDVMHEYELNPMLYDDGAGSSFTVYIKVSAIAATCIASPWLLYQIWMFVAAGLYPAERKVITKHIPLSVALLLSGVAFAYYVVLPMTLQFFIWFSTTIKLPDSYEPVPTTQPMNLVHIPLLPGDPPKQSEGDMWFNTQQSRLKMYVAGKIRIVQYTSENLVAPMLRIDDYTDLLLMMMLTFGLSFQTPLAVMLLVRVGIFELADLKAARRIVYFVLVILSAVITPGDVVTATLALMLPLCGLYELGLLLARDPKPDPSLAPIDAVRDADDAPR